MSYTLYKGDCLEEMKKIPDGSVDMVLCDLPYGTTACAWDAVIPMEELWEAYRRILTPLGAVVLTGSQPFTTTLIASNLDWFKYCWVWEKNRPTNFAHAKNKPMKKHEDVCVFSPGTTVHASQSQYRMTYNPQGLVAVDRQHKAAKRKNPVDTFFSARDSHGDYTQTATGYPHSILSFATDMTGLHPTAKPVALMEYLIRTYTKEGDTVLDNCMGSGTTGAACANTGRKFIGIERDEKYFDIAKSRIEQAFNGRLI